jgi:hypothetical protein
MSTSSSLINRMIRASKLEVALYEEVEADTSATSQAVLAVILVSIISGIGTAIGAIIAGGGLRIIWGLLGGIVGSLLGWLAWSFFTWLLGTTVFKGPETKSSWGELMRTIGFAYSPGVFRFFSFIPFLGPVISFAALVWSLIAGVIAVRQALDFSTGRAIATCIVGWIIYVIVMVLVALLVGGIGFGLGMRGIF